MLDFNLLKCYLLNMKDIHKQFVQLGRKRNKITYKLLALLPKIFEKEIYRKHGCATIYEYAGRFGGLSHGVVEKTLKLEEKLVDKPELQAAIETQGVHKVAIVANVATPETDKAWADKVENMSKRSLQELSREVRGKKEKIKIELDEEMEFLFLKLKKEMGISSNKEALRQILKSQQKPQVVTKNTGEKRDNSSKSCSRHISAARKREVDDCCVFPGCNKPAEILHHCKRFAKQKSHDSVVGLCREHHEFAHNGLVINEHQDPSSWKVDPTRSPTEQSDQLYRKYRQVALL